MPAKRKAGGEATQFRTSAERRKMPLMRVVVGEEPQSKTYHIQSELPVKHSQFFRAALKGTWKESKSRTVVLEDDNPEHFEVFKNFIYHCAIYTSNNGDEHRDKDGTLRNDEWPRLMQSWQLGDKMLSTSFKDSTVDACVAKVQEEQCWGTDLHPLIYPSSKSTSALRKLLIDIAVRNWNEETLVDATKAVENHEFTRDVLLAERKRNIAGPKMKSPIEKPQSCQYQEHIAAGTACYTTMFPS